MESAVLSRRSLGRVIGIYGDASRIHADRLPAIVDYDKPRRNPSLLQAENRRHLVTRFILVNNWERSERRPQEALANSLSSDLGVERIPGAPAEPIYKVRHLPWTEDVLLRSPVKRWQRASR